jgi:hypothetical protein
MSMASTLVDWATDKVMAPHADHVDPSQHPQCLVCRATRVMGAGGPTGSPAVREHRTITWIDIEDEPADPRHPRDDPSA